MRQKILDNITKTFDADAQPVPGDAAGPFARTLEKLHHLIQFREGETLENHALERKETGLRRKLSRPFAPAFTVKILERLFRGDALPGFLARKQAEHELAQCVTRAGQFLDPLALHVNISKRSHGVKKIAAAMLQFAPAWGWIHLIERVGHSAATAESGAQIVHVVGVPIGRHFVRSFEDAFHPHIETCAMRMSAGGDISWMCQWKFPNDPRGQDGNTIL